MPSHRKAASALNGKISQAQKNRSQLACIWCRARRIKCDGQLDTCGRCLAAGYTNCTYEKVKLEERVASRERKRSTRGKQKEEIPEVHQAPSPLAPVEPLPDLIVESGSIPYPENRQLEYLQSTIPLLGEANVERQESTNMRKRQYTLDLYSHHERQQSARAYSKSSSSSSALLTPSITVNPSSLPSEATSLLLLGSQAAQSLDYNTPFLSPDGISELNRYKNLVGCIENGPVVGISPGLSLNMHAPTSNWLGRDAAAQISQFTEEQLFEYRGLFGSGNSRQNLESEERTQGEMSTEVGIGPSLPNQTMASNWQVPVSLNTGWGPFDY